MRQTRLQNPDSIMLEMRSCLEEKFQVFDSKLVKLRHGIETRSHRLIKEIEYRLDLDSQCDKLHNKRNELLIQLFNAESMNVTATNTTSSKLYHKYDENRSELELVRYLIFKHTQLVYHNDFELFSKFRYYHLFNDLRPAHPPSDSTSHFKKQSFFILNANARLIHCKENEQLLLTNRRFEAIKRVKIKERYSCYQMFKLLQYIILNFTSQQLKKSQLYG